MSYEDYPKVVRISVEAKKRLEKLAYERKVSEAKFVSDIILEYQE